MDTLDAQPESLISFDIAVDGAAATVTISGELDMSSIDPNAFMDAFIDVSLHGMMASESRLR